MNNISLVNLGVTLVLLNMGEVATMLHDQNVSIYIEEDTWINGVVAINCDDTVEVSTALSKVVVYNDGTLDIVKMSSDDINFNDITHVLEVVHLLSIKQKYIDVSIVKEEPAEEIKPILPLRVGKGFRKSYDSITKILRNHFINSDDIQALKFLNSDILAAVKTYGGKYVNHKTDVVISCYENNSVLLEGNEFSVILPALINNGRYVPYAMFSSLDARELKDLTEVAAMLHAIRELIIGAAIKTRG